MASSKITIKITFAKWGWLYLWGLQTFCFVTGCDPDLQKVANTIMKGVVLKVDYG